MGERIEWTIEEITDLAQKLNRIGIQYEDEVAHLYNLFKLQITKQWTGKNINTIIDFLNDECKKEFHTIALSLAEAIPNGIMQIAEKQAADGKGQVSSFSIEGSSTIFIPPIERTPETADGKITLEQETVEQYFKGNGKDSLEGCKESIKEQLTKYQQLVDDFNAKYNDAITSIQTLLDSFKSRTDTKIEQIIELTKVKADQELGKITEADAAAKERALKLTQDVAESGATPQSTYAGSGATPQSTYAGSGATPQSTYAGSGATPQSTYSAAGFVTGAAGTAVAADRFVQSNAQNPDAGKGGGTFGKFYSGNSYWDKIGDDYKENFDKSNCDDVSDYVRCMEKGVGRTVIDGVQTYVNGDADTIQAGLEFLEGGGEEGDGIFNESYYSNVPNKFKSNFDLTGDEGLGDIAIDGAAGILKSVADGTDVLKHIGIDTFQQCIEWGQGGINWGLDKLEGAYDSGVDIYHSIKDTVGEVKDYAKENIPFAKYLPFF